MCSGKVLNGYGVARHLFLSHSSGDKKTLNGTTILLRSGKVLLKSSDGAEQEFILVTTHKSSNNGTVYSSKRE